MRSEWLPRVPEGAGNCRDLGTGPKIHPLRMASPFSACCWQLKSCPENNGRQTQQGMLLLLLFLTGNMPVGISFCLINIKNLERQEKLPFPLYQEENQDLSTPETLSESRAAAGAGTAQTLQKASVQKGVDERTYPASTVYSCP